MSRCRALRENSHWLMTHFVLKIICLSTYLSVCLSVCLCMYVCMYVSIYLSTYLPTYLPILVLALLVVEHWDIVYTISKYSFPFNGGHNFTRKFKFGLTKQHCHFCLVKPTSDQNRREDHDHSRSLGLTVT